MDKWSKLNHSELKKLEGSLHKGVNSAMGKAEMNQLLRDSKMSFDDLGRANSSKLLKVQSDNSLRRAKVIEFVDKQMKAMKSVSMQIAARQKKYMNVRKKIWMENDDLNRMENQKVRKLVGCYELYHWKCGASIYQLAKFKPCNVLLLLYVFK